MDFMRLTSYVEATNPPKLKKILIRCIDISAVEELTGEEDKLHRALVILKNGRALRSAQDVDTVKAHLTQT